MSFFTTIKNWFIHTEKDVLAFNKKVWDEIPVAAKEIAGVAKWITNTGIPALTADVNTILPFIGILGDLSGHPELRNNVAALNDAVAAVNKFAIAAQSGNITADDVVQGYGQLKAAQAAASAVTATAAHIIAVTPPENPPKTA